MADQPDTLVPDPQVRSLFGVTSMTLYRWTNDPDLGFPQPIRIRSRNYRSRRALDAWLLEKGISAAKGKLPGEGNQGYRRKDTPTAKVRLSSAKGRLPDPADEFL